MTVRTLMVSAEKGDPQAADALFSALYEALNRLARRQLARKGGGLTLGTTTLLHEAYLDMSRREGTRFPDENRFMAYAARVMRNIIIDYARNRRAQKRGGLFEITTYDTNAQGRPDDRELSRIGGALDELYTVESALAEVVDLKFFCGFSFAEIAAMRDVSERTVQRQWRKARIYLRQTLEGVDL